MKTLTPVELKQIDGGIFSFLHYIWHGGNSDEVLLCNHGYYDIPPIDKCSWE